MAERMMRASEVAEVLGVKTQTVYSMSRNGKLPGFRIAGTRTLRFRENDVQAALEPAVPAMTVA